MLREPAFVNITDLTSSAPSCLGDPNPNQWPSEVVNRY